MLFKILDPSLATLAPKSLRLNRANPVPVFTVAYWDSGKCWGS